MNRQKIVLFPFFQFLENSVLLVPQWNSVHVICVFFCIPQSPVASLNQAWIWRLYFGQIQDVHKTLWNIRDILPDFLISLKCYISTPIVIAKKNKTYSEYLVNVIWTIYMCIQSITLVKSCIFYTMIIPAFIKLLKGSISWCSRQSPVSLICSRSILVTLIA